jgi:hypothetical protein
MQLHPEVGEVPGEQRDGGGGLPSAHRVESDDGLRGQVDACALAAGMAGVVVAWHAPALEHRDERQIRVQFLQSQKGADGARLMLPHGEACFGQDARLALVVLRSVVSTFRFPS